MSTSRHPDLSALPDAMTAYRADNSGTHAKLSALPDAITTYRADNSGRAEFAA
jgi:hypothetical protein